MSSYFAEAEIKKRLTRYYRRRFVFIIHTILTIAIFMGGAGYGIYTQEIYITYDVSFQRNFSPGRMWTDIVIILGIMLVPLLFHAMYVYYREKLEKAIEREILSTSSMQLDKRKYSADDFLHLQTEDEFILEEADERDAVSHYKRR